MTTNHQFLLQPGNWIGEGKVSFNASSETLRFYTKWIIEKTSNQAIICTQEVEMPGANPNMFNSFSFSKFTESSFAVELENELLGHVKGNGILDEKTIAWEFHGQGGLEGYEVYELQDNGDYIMHAEYASPDQFRTIIDGRIWKKLA